jgi:hypothetical protein
MHGMCFSFYYPWITFSFLYKETSHFDIRILEQNISLSLSQIILLEISIKQKNYVAVANLFTGTKNHHNNFLFILCYLQQSPLKH